MGVTKKKGNRNAVKGPRTYTNYGRQIPSRTKLTADIIKFRIKLHRLVESGKLAEADKPWAARLCDGLDVLLGVE